MGWAVVLDPYVADLADNNVVCQKIVSTVYYSADHAFVVDKGQVLLEKYEQLARSKPEGWVPKSINTWSSHSYLQMFPLLLTSCA